MCDTLVVMPDASKDGVTLFAKNSDRPESDSQGLVTTERGPHPSGSKTKTQYVEVPQAPLTYRTLGFRPYWCWGYETGMNEHRVAIGNEAIYTKALYQEENRRERGLIGMDMVRLALERAKSAYEALHVIADLTERYGQWGSAVPGQSDEEGSYDNSFIIADPEEAWVLELAGRRWVARRITQGTYSISNEPTITTHWDESSKDLTEYAVEQGWWPASRRDSFSFALAYGAHEQYSRQVSHIRLMRSRQLLEERRGQVDVPWLVRILRDHFEDTFLNGPMFSPDNPDFLTLCMHASPAGFTWGNTASSAVVVLPGLSEQPAIFWASMVTPCTSVFNPYFIDAPIPSSLAKVGMAGATVQAPASAPVDQYASISPWWAFKGLLETISRDFNARAPIARATFSEVEKRRFKQAESIQEEVLALRGEGRQEEATQLLATFVVDCFEETLRTLHRLKDILSRT